PELSNEQTWRLPSHSSPTITLGFDSERERRSCRIHGPIGRNPRLFDLVRANARRGGLWSADDGNFHQVDLLEEAWQQ
ncbi:unnamed protein product, partial [Musa textilis]